jgi:hypothetical protein
MYRKTHDNNFATEHMIITLQRSHAPVTLVRVRGASREARFFPRRPGSVQKLENIIKTLRRSTLKAHDNNFATEFHLICDENILEISSFSFLSLFSLLSFFLAVVRFLMAGVGPMIRLPIPDRLMSGTVLLQWGVN